MPEPDLFLLFVRPLNRAGLRYVVSGSVAAIFYGEPRLTHAWISSSTAKCVGETTFRCPLPSPLPKGRGSG